MTADRDALPQLSGGVFLTDGGIETTLMFRDGLDLPSFAAFDLLKRDAGCAALRGYFRAYAAIAREHGVGLILESATWRASPDWGAKLGYAPAALVEANRKAIELLQEIRREFETDRTPVVISGCLGPRDDGYNPQAWMNPDEARRYHAVQMGAFREAGADMACAITMTYPDEAIGITRAAQAAKLPVAISFTVETDGRLPNGQSLGEGIEAVDRATGNGPAYYMINCAHPSHFDRVLAGKAPWVERIRGLRANASAKSHAELNDSTTLDAGDPDQLAADYRRITDRLRRITVLGGCCGTDERHVSAIARACIGKSAT